MGKDPKDTKGGALNQNCHHLKNLLAPNTRKLTTRFLPTIDYVG